jgi:hypothetical protein
MNPQEQKATTGPSSESEGTSWQFLLIIIVIAIGVLGINGKALGLY